MHNKFFELTSVGFIAGLLLIGCQNPKANRPDTVKINNAEIKPDSQAAHTSFSDDWRNFKTEAEKKIENNKKKIAAFKGNMKKTGTAMKAKYNNEITNLEETNRQMKKTLENYKNGGKNVWADFKTGFNNAMNKLGNSIDSLFTEQS
jgi:predicted RNase H-like nuclease (RuvC/YqgF family)